MSFGLSPSLRDLQTLQTKQVQTNAPKIPDRQKPSLKKTTKFQTTKPVQSSPHWICREKTLPKTTFEQPSVLKNLLKNLAKKDTLPSNTKQEYINQYKCLPMTSDLMLMAQEDLHFKSSCKQIPQEVSKLEVFKIDEKPKQKEVCPKAVLKIKKDVWVHRQGPEAVQDLQEFPKVPEELELVMEGTTEVASNRNAMQKRSSKEYWRSFAVPKAPQKLAKPERRFTQECEESEFTFFGESKRKENLIMKVPHAQHAKRVSKQKNLRKKYN